MSDYKIYPNSDNKHLPDHIHLAKELSLNQAKMNKILNELLNYTFHDFDDPPLFIKDMVNILHISSYFEPEERNEAWVQNSWEIANPILAVIQVTPRIGDYVESPYMRMS